MHQEMVLIYNFTYNDYIKFIHNIKQESSVTRAYNNIRQSYTGIKEKDVESKYKRILHLHICPLAYVLKLYT